MKIAKLALAVVMLGLAPAWADEWVRCAVENEYCRTDGTATVRFGAGNRWATQSVRGGTNCTVTAFSDPAPGIRKVCEVLVQVRVPQNREERREDRREDRGDDRYNARTWEKCAGESGYCRVNGTETVKYGAGSQWATRRVNGGIKCSPAGFGVDPAIGIQKSCYIVYQEERRRGNASNEAPSWVKCANEGGTCRFEGRRRVSYGVGTQWAYAIRSGAVGCNTASFGGDPALGREKACYYESN